MRSDELNFERFFVPDENCAELKPDAKLKNPWCELTSAKARVTMRLAENLRKVF